MSLTHFLGQPRSHALVRPLLTALALVASSRAGAAQVYVDALGGAGGNTYNNATNSLDDWWTATSSTSDNKWTLRTTGPALVAYNTTEYEINNTPEVDVPLRTEITGLTPNTTYTGMRLYMIGRALATAAETWHIDASVNGTTWTTYVDFDNAGYAGTLVDTSNNGIGATITSTPTPTEKRVWYALPNATTDATGKLKIYIRRGTGANNRSVYDGIGYDAGVTPLPPSLASATSTGITSGQATLGGNVSTDNGAAVTARGVVLAPTATNSNPLLGGTGVSNLTATGTTGVFTVTATGLTSGTGYSFKAYATNANGTTYSAVSTFTTAIPSDPYANSVYISEFMADNPMTAMLPGTVADMDGDNSDWIELHNSGATPADLSGWKLTDNALLPGKWTFPVGTLLNPNARLLVFASGKNRQISNVELHTNFKLATSGFLRLSRPAPTGPDVVLSTFDATLGTYPAQNPRASYGTTTTNPASLAYGYFTTPTPNAANAATSVPDFVKGTGTDVDRGIFSAPFNVTLSCPTPGSTLLYTTNGSVPTVGGSGVTSVPALDSLSLPVATISITGTTVLRTRAVKTGFGPSKTDSHTYLFPAQVLTQTAPPANYPAAAAWSHYGTYDWAMDPAIVNHADPASKCTVNDLMSIPSVSLVMDWSELFGTSGIYPAISPVPQEGLDKAASLELINSTGSSLTPNAGEQFAIEGTSHVFGGTSQTRWKVDKLSLNFNAQGSVSTNVYGDTAVGTYGKFVLDARMGNTWLHATDDVQRTRGDYIRDETAAETQRSMGYAGTHSRRIHLYLNGMYWGLYTLHEKPSADFQAAYQGGNSEDWDVLKHNPNYHANDDCLSDGTYVNPALTSATKTNNTAYVNYLAMLATVANGVDLSNSTNYANAGAKLDIDAFIDYMVMNFALNNFDWSHQNWYASYRRTSPTGRWRFHSWDAEHVLRTDTEETIAASISGTGVNSLLTDCNQADTPTFIHQRLSTNAEYRMRFADRIQKWCYNGGVLTSAGITAICNRQFNEIDAAMRCESARWGDNRAPVRAAPNTNVTYTRGVEWLAEKNRMLALIPNRLTIFLAAMKTKANPLFPRVDPAVTTSALFLAPAYAQHGGRVASNYNLAISNPNALGTIYYSLDGSDPRLTGGTLNPAALTYAAPVPLTGSVTVRSRVKNGTVWSALNEATFSVGTTAPAPSNLIISKIMWKPSAPTAAEIAAGFTDDSEFEFLELYNPSASPVDLTGLSFSSGLDIAPASADPVDLAPGARAVLVSKPAAFAYRYGNSAKVVGKFVNGSNLSGSERLTLLDSLGNTLTSFVYNETTTGPWPKTQTSGTGSALVLVSPETRPDPSLGSSWRASSAAAASPGADDRPSLSTWQTTNFGGTTDLTADPDKDGLPNLVEFALGLNPNSRDSNARLPSASLTTYDPGTGPRPALQLSVRRQKLLETITWTVEYADALGTWSSAPGPVETISTVDEGDGTETVTYRTVLGEGVGARFLRLKLVSP